jgi:hypothetical protein
MTFNTSNINLSKRQGCCLLSTLVFLFSSINIKSQNLLTPRTDGVYVYLNEAKGHLYYGDSISYIEEKENALKIFGEIGTCLNIPDCHTQKRQVQTDFFKSEFSSVLYFINDTVVVESSWGCNDSIYIKTNTILALLGKYRMLDTYGDYSKKNISIKDSLINIRIVNGGINEYYGKIKNSNEIMLNLKIIDPIAIQVYPYEVKYKFISFNELFK